MDTSHAPEASDTVDSNAGLLSPVNNDNNDQYKEISSSETVTSRIGPSRALFIEEPYDRLRAHDLRAECYRRGIRPIKKGPNANDNKSGYVELLRKSDTEKRLRKTPPIISPPAPVATNRKRQVSPEHPALSSLEILDSVAGSNHPGGITIKKTPTSKKRKLPSTAQATVSYAASLSSFYDSSTITEPHTSFVPVIPFHYPNFVRPAAVPQIACGESRGDLEILSGIANHYKSSTTENATHTALADGMTESSDACSMSNTVDEESQSGNFGHGSAKSSKAASYVHQPLRQNPSQCMEECIRLTGHLRNVIQTLAQLRSSLQEQDELDARSTNSELKSSCNTEEVQDDIALFEKLKKQAKARLHRLCSDLGDAS